MPSDIWILRFVEQAACFLLAASASLQARRDGAQIGGALVLGLMIGLALPLARELAHRDGFYALVETLHIPPALVGGLAGCLILIPPWLGRRASSLFYLMDSAGMACAVCAQIWHLLFISSINYLYALALGVIFGLVPGIFRDMALGGPLLMLEDQWHAMAALLGGILFLLLLLLGLEAAPACFGAIALILLLRHWGRRSH